MPKRDAIEAFAQILSEIATGCLLQEALEGRLAIHVADVDRDALLRELIFKVRLFESLPVQKMVAFGGGKYGV